MVRGNSLESDCGKLAKKYFALRKQIDVLNEVVFGKGGEVGVPPSPHPSECLDWRGFYKNGLQNLEPVGVTGQNLDKKEVTSFSRAMAYDRFRLDDDLLFKFLSQG